MIAEIDDGGTYARRPRDQGERDDAIARPGVNRSQGWESSVQRRKRRVLVGVQVRVKRRDQVADAPLRDRLVVDLHDLARELQPGRRARPDEVGDERNEA